MPQTLVATARSRTARRSLGVVALLLLFVMAVRTYTVAVQRHYDFDVDAPRVDLNRAGLDELTELPGVGPALARKIVGERETAGPFRTGDELAARVEGIGHQRLALMLDYATLGSVD